MADLLVEQVGARSEMSSSSGTEQERSIAPLVEGGESPGTRFVRIAGTVGQAMIIIGLLLLLFRPWIGGSLIVTGFVLQLPSRAEHTPTG